MISQEQVIEAQNEWGNGVVKIGSLKENRSECETFTNAFLDKLYSFDLNLVLFKPTKCKIEQFRPTKKEALSSSLPAKIVSVRKMVVLQLTLGQK